MNQMPKFLILTGVFLIGIGVLWWMLGKSPWFGKLPGDIRIEREGFSFYFPFVTCLILSLLITFLLNLFGKK